MSNPNCPTLKFILTAVDEKDSTLFEDFKIKMDKECRVQSRVAKFLVQGVVEDKIKLPDSTINKKEFKKRSNLI